MFNFNRQLIARSAKAAAVTVVGASIAFCLVAFISLEAAHYIPFIAVGALSGFCSSEWHRLYFEFDKTRANAAALIGCNLAAIVLTMGAVNLLKGLF